MVIIMLLIVNFAMFFYLDSKIKKLMLDDEKRIAQKTVSPEETKLRENFNESMNFRLVGNCDSFADSVSNSDEKARENWGERCRLEKELETSPLSDIIIKRLSIKDDNAFVQAELSRVAEYGEIISYTGTYDLKMEDGRWKMLSPEDQPEEEKEDEDEE